MVGVEAHGHEFNLDGLKARVFRTFPVGLAVLHAEELQPVLVGQLVQRPAHVPLQRAGGPLGQTRLQVREGLLSPLDSVGQLSEIGELLEFLVARGFRCAPRGELPGEALGRVGQQEEAHTQAQGQARRSQDEPEAAGTQGGAHGRPPSSGWGGRWRIGGKRRFIGAGRTLGTAVLSEG
ncbi:hypothetical protein GALL_544910 [mine drainage metagenome]|uniref:Uncharacterized protein n=1 Tax=mine drainage metagenome TaxID=410659 RepID=A0A1J5PFD1_9ZZZZ